MDHAAEGLIGILEGKNFDKAVLVTSSSSIKEMD
jgi:hypothetical protein